MADPINSSDTVITATTWLAGDLQRSHAWERHRLGERVWGSPDILSMDAWLRRTWQEAALEDPAPTPVLLSSAQERILWEDAIRGTVDDSILLNVPQTAAAAARAWDLLHRWDEPLDFDGFEPSADTEAFRGWAKVVHARLRGNGWITQSELPGTLAKRIAMGSRMGGSAMTAAGFDEPPPAIRRLLEEMGARSLPSPKVPSSVRRVQMHDSAAELTAAAWWTRRCLEASPERRIGVIICGMAAITAQIERVFDDVLHSSLDFRAAAPRAFHISGGTRFSRVPMISAALLLLQLADEMSLPEAGMLLRSAFVEIETAGRLDCDYRLRRQGVSRVSIRLEIMRRCFPELARMIERLPRRQRPWQWSGAFSRMLAAGGWLKGRPLSSPEHRALRQWSDLLSEFAQLDPVLPELTLSQALARLRQMAERSRFVVGEPGAPVQILDITEAAGAKFDALWVAGLHAGAWPAPARQNSFLPLAIQQRLGMPDCSPEFSLESARRVTERLSAAAPEVVFSSPAVGRDEELRASPLLEQFPKTEGIEPLGETVLQRVFLSSAALEECSWGRGANLAEGTKQRGGVRLLERQAACPFQAFAVHRLGARELSEPPLGVSAAEHGSAAHKALEQFWNHVKTHRALVELRAAERAGIVSESVSEALDGGLGSRGAGAGMARFTEIEHARLCRLIEEWLDKEARRQPFEVVRSESEEEVEVGGLLLSVRPDRIDRYNDSRRHAILDYKTSNILSPKQWEGDRPDAPQLPLYAVTSTEPVEEIAFAKLVPGAVKLIADPDTVAHIPEWRGVIERLAREFRSGVAVVDPKRGAGTCRLCRLTSLCRVRELREAQVADESGGGDA